MISRYVYNLKLNTWFKSCLQRVVYFEVCIALVTLMSKIQGGFKLEISY